MDNPVCEILVDAPAREVGGEGTHSVELHDAVTRLVEYVWLFCRLVPVEEEYPKVVDGGDGHNGEGTSVDGWSGLDQEG